MRHVLPSIVFSLAATAFALPLAPAPQSNALDLLTRVVQHYADAKPYDIQLTEEITSTREFYRHWSKSVLIAAETPGNRLHFEGQTNEGRSLRVSDGKTIWNYHAVEHRYTAKPWTADEHAEGGPFAIFAISEQGAAEAKNLRVLLQSMVKRLASAEFLPDEDLTVDGRRIHCKVVHIRNTDEKRIDPNYRFDKRIWIDPDRLVILKTTERRNSFLISGAGGIPLEDDVTTVYTRTAIDEALPNDLFSFRPPADAHMIAEFPDPADNFGMSSMAGDLIPPLKFRAADGTIKPVESFRGKPVLIDFWATWCAPCVAAMPELAEIYKESKSKGLVLLSVDLDEDAAKAAEFLKKHGYDWPNFHDGDGAIAKLLPSAGIPHGTCRCERHGDLRHDGDG